MVAALVLSAGLGTRLRPLTLELPKALVPIGDRPALAHIVDRLAGFGFAPRVANAHHHADALEAFARGGESASFVVSREEELLGTAGGLAFARSRLRDGEAGGDVVVWNGDLFAELPADLFASLPEGAGAALVVQAGGAPGAGNVGLAADGRIVRLRSTSIPGGPAETASASFLGAHRLGAKLVDRAPAQGCLVADLYIPALLRGERLIARPTATRWIDVGSPAAYRAANLAWLGDSDGFVGAGAEIDPAVTLRASVIGRGARVVGHGLLERVVVWPGAVARAPLADAVVTPTQVVEM
jgi:NDP-sugar pyrophosphorylase family protein